METERSEHSTSISEPSTAELEERKYEEIEKTQYHIQTNTENSTNRFNKGFKWFNACITLVSFLLSGIISLCYTQNWFTIYDRGIFIVILAVINISVRIFQSFFGFYYQRKLWNNVNIETLHQGDKIGDIAIVHIYMLVSTVGDCLFDIIQGYILINNIKYESDVNLYVIIGTWFGVAEELLDLIEDALHLFIDECCESVVECFGVITFCTILMVMIVIEQLISIIIAIKGISFNTSLLIVIISLNLLTIVIAVWLLYLLHQKYYIFKKAASKLVSTNLVIPTGEKYELNIKEYNLNHIVMYENSVLTIDSNDHGSVLIQVKQYIILHDHCSIQIYGNNPVKITCDSLEMNEGSTLSDISSIIVRKVLIMNHDCKISGPDDPYDDDDAKFVRSITCTDLRMMNYCEIEYMDRIIVNGSIDMTESSAITNTSLQNSKINIGEDDKYLSVKENVNIHPEKLEHNTGLWLSRSIMSFTIPKKITTDLTLEAGEYFIHGDLEITPFATLSVKPESLSKLVLNIKGHLTMKRQSKISVSNSGHGTSQYPDTKSQGGNAMKGFAGGGGYGTAGKSGYAGTHGLPVGKGGACTGESTLRDEMHFGAAGGWGLNGEGGRGGGILILNVKGTLFMEDKCVISSDGSDGKFFGGGGSGGSIKIICKSLIQHETALISAKGGQRGEKYWQQHINLGDSGQGGNGRIAVYSNLGHQIRSDPIAYVNSTNKVLMRK